VRITSTSTENTEIPHQCSPKHSYLCLQNSKGGFNEITTISNQPHLVNALQQRWFGARESLLDAKTPSDAQDSSGSRQPHTCTWAVAYPNWPSAQSISPVTTLRMRSRTLRKTTVYLQFVCVFYLIKCSKHTTAVEFIERCVAVDTKTSREWSEKNNNPFPQYVYPLVVSFFSHRTVGLR
jgi:hypothetical protein